MHVRAPRTRFAIVPIVMALLAAGCSSSARRDVEPLSALEREHPNIVFILTDDLDLTSYANAVRFPQFHKLLTEAGTTFSNFFVTDSLCCPSRASILRGQYVHNHGVASNGPSDGGFQRFQQLNRNQSTIATWLHAAGYRTALFGKYLNGYPTTAAPTYVPPGWDEWASPSAGNAYAEYNYQLNENGTLHNYGAKSSDYLVDVLTRKARAFIQGAPRGHPFFMYVAPYVPHQPATPAPRFAHKFKSARAPRTASWNQADVAREPEWLRNRPPLTRAVTTEIDQLYRRRLRDMLSIDDMLKTIVDTLRSTGELDNTYIVFTSDNGFHMGQHRLAPGKSTPFDEDIHVPLVVRGPDVPANATVHGFAREIDLAPTMAALAHASVPGFVDGMSLAPMVHGRSMANGPTDLLVEHYSGTQGPDDDANPPVEGAPKKGAAAPIAIPRAEAALALPTYFALRTPRYLFVQYQTGEEQLYNLKSDPNELDNLIGIVPQAVVTPLATRLTQLEHCAGASCR